MSPDQELRLFSDKLEKVLTKKHLGDKPIKCIPMYIRRNGPHKALYTKIYNEEVWLCWLKKYELNILNSMGVDFYHD